jgi:hypothetical protein
MITISDTETITITGIAAIVEPITYNEQRRVGIAMIKYGGSFIHALGEAIMYADAYNARVLKEAFPVEWKYYFNL